MIHPGNSRNIHAVLQNITTLFSTLKYATYLKTTYIANENRTLIPAENIPKGSKILKKPLIIEKSLQYYSVYQNVQIIN